MPIENLDSFNLELEKSSKFLRNDLFIKFHKRVALDVLDGAVSNTPKKSGRAKANWITTVGEQTEREVEGGEDDFQGITDGAVNQSGLLALANLQFGAVIYIQNNVFYIIFLENGTPRIPAIMMLQESLDRVETSLAVVA